jgi:hygromycin-B 4-O-kinase
LGSGALRRPSVELEQASAFLGSHLGSAGEVGDVCALVGGEHSRAFGFRSEGRALVLRVGHSDAGYRKDRFAHEHLASDRLPVPRVLEIGAFDEERSFAISERAAGGPLAAEPREEIPLWLDAIFAVLLALHQQQPPGAGYGAFDGVTGDSSYSTFQEALLALARPDGADWDRERSTRAREHFRSLVPACPEHRHVVHADVSGFNLLGEHHQVTALVDFGLAMYGEPVYDLAQVVFGLPHLDHTARIRAHLDALGISADLLEERLRCYQLAVCLQSFQWSAATGQRDRYLASCARAEELIAAAC